MNPFSDSATQQQPLEHFGHAGRNKGKLLIEEWKCVVDQDLMADRRLVGQELAKFTQQVDSQFVPDMTPTYGRLGVRVATDGTAQVCRLSYILMNTESVFIPKQIKAAFELGGKGVTISGAVVSAVPVLPNPDALGLNVVDSSTEHIDQAHGFKQTTSVGEWLAMVDEVLKDPRAGGNRVRITKQVVASATALPAKGANDLEIKSEWVAEGRELQTVVTAPDGLGTMTSYDWCLPEFGVKGTITEQIVDIATFTAPEPDYLVVSQKLTNLGNGTGKFVRITVEAFPKLLEFSEDPETGVTVCTKSRIVAATPISRHGATAGTITTIKDLDAYRMLRTDRVIAQVGGYNKDFFSRVWVEYHNVRFQVPAYLKTPAFTVFNVGTGTDARSLVSANRGSDKSVSLPAKFVIQYSATRPTSESIFQLQPVDVSVVTPDWAVRERDVLTDGGDLVVQFGTQSYTFPVAESDPTVTAYKAMVGSEVIIADEVEKWKYHLWKRVLIFIKLPPLAY